MMKRNVIPFAMLFILVTAFLVAPVAAAGLTVTDGAKITAMDGATSPAITIADADIAAGDTITINITDLNTYVASGPLTDANVEITSTALNALWTGAVADGNLTLTSTFGNTTAGEMVFVTFTGAGNPWTDNTGGNKTVPLTATRTDGGGEGPFNFIIEIPIGSLTATDGEKINTTEGATSPIITITNAPIAQNGTITIDVSMLNFYISSFPVTTNNVIVNDTAGNATWTGVVAYDDPTVTYILTLTSTGGPTYPGETVNVTFTGAGGNPWVDTTNGLGDFPLTATRTDTAQTATINFLIETVLPPQSGLSITDGVKITTARGATSPVINITDHEIAQNGTITINVKYLQSYVASYAFTTDNVVVNDTAANATWTGVVVYNNQTDANILTLTSTGGNTTVGETVNVTFTGAGGNPWVSSTGGEVIVLLTAKRTDGFGQGYFNFDIDTVPLGGLSVANGTKITATEGNTSPVITVTNTDIAQNGTITINVTSLNGFVANGSLTPANVEITSYAASALWTGVVTDGNLTLTSTGGPTAVGETVTVTFTGAAGNPWISDTAGEKTALLTATRTDTLEAGSFSFIIATGGPSPNFSASPTADIAPATITFNDTSQGSPISWSWDFGDGANSTSQNPTHTYTNIGTYTVSLTATNALGSNTRIRTDYINVLNGAIREANTSIDGLTITNCGGPQTITIDASILPAALIPNNSVLEIQPPADRGLKNITIYALNGVGFSQNGTLITGNPTGVHLVTDEIAPSTGFLNYIGTNASFNYSIDLSSYPCNAILSTKILEGVISEDDYKFRWVASNNSAFPIGTAYTARITKTNFPTGAPAKVHMSVSSSWNPSLTGGPGNVFIWHIADDGNSGQIFPTTYLYNNTADNLDYYEADSPLGLSTFGISSLTGNNNPFQIIAFVATAVISPPSNPSTNPSASTGASTGGGTSGAGQTTVASGATSPDQSKTVKIYSNDEGTITQATTLQSTDGLAKISLDLGFVARDSNGRPLESLSIRRIPAEELPAAPPLATFSFAGMAYEIGPDGATFSPAIPLSFTIPQEQAGQDYVIHQYDHATGTWQALPGSYDPQSGTITVQVSHFCCFALFAKSTEMEKAVTPEPTIIIASKSPISTNIEMYGWIFAMIVQNPVTLVIMLAALAMVAYFGWWKRRL